MQSRILAYEEVVSKVRKLAKCVEKATVLHCSEVAKKRGKGGKTAVNMGIRVCEITPDPAVKIGNCFRSGASRSVARQGVSRRERRAGA